MSLLISYILTLTFDMFHVSCPTPTDAPMKSIAAEMTESLGTLPKDLLLALEDSNSDGDSDDEAELFIENLDLDSELEEEEDEVLEEEPRLFISREHAKANYAKAGRELQEQESDIKVEDYAAIMDKGVEQLFDEIVKDVELPYRPVPFQGHLRRCTGLG